MQVVEIQVGATNLGATLCGMREFLDRCRTDTRQLSSLDLSYPLGSNRSSKEKAMRMSRTTNFRSIVLVLSQGLPGLCGGPSNHA